jgi:hypothetical protein
LSGDATFLQRLLVGWTRSDGVKLVPFSEEQQTIRAWLDVGRVSFKDVTREKRAAQWGRLVVVMSWSGQPPVVRLCGRHGDSDKSGGAIWV